MQTFIRNIPHGPIIVPGLTKETEQRDSSVNE
jgi:hypothetical protein